MCISCQEFGKTWERPTNTDVVLFRWIIAHSSWFLVEFMTKSPQTRNTILRKETLVQDFDIGEKCDFFSDVAWFSVLCDSVCKFECDVTKVLRDLLENNFYLWNSIRLNTITISVHRLLVFCSFPLWSVDLERFSPAYYSFISAHYLCHTLE